MAGLYAEASPHGRAFLACVYLTIFTVKVTVFPVLAAPLVAVTVFVFTEEWAAKAAQIGHQIPRVRTERREILIQTVRL
jgi:hypothetical protein